MSDGTNEPCIHDCCDGINGSVRPVFKLTRGCLKNLPLKNLSPLLKYLDTLLRSPDIEALLKGNYTAGTRLRQQVRAMSGVVKDLDGEIRTYMNQFKTKSKNKSQSD